MSYLLNINSSLFGVQGNSSQVAQMVVDQWQKANPDANVVLRDLSTNPVPHLDGGAIGALFTAPEERTDAQRDFVAFADGLIEEFSNASAIVIGVPMYNFAIPSTLKAYFDHLARAGVTFQYTEQGPKGMLTNKPVYIAAARGGVYEGSPADTQTQYIRDFLGFLGLTSVEFIYAEGVNMGMKDAALSAASEKIAALIPA